MLGGKHGGNMSSFTVIGITSGLPTIIRETDSAREARTIMNAGTSPFDQIIVKDGTGAELTRLSLNLLAEAEGKNA
jgi:hypothetical protein